MTKYIQATCQLQPNFLETGGNTGVEGRFMLYGVAGGPDITIMGTATGLTDGKHGFAVLTGNDIVAGCDGAGERFNPAAPDVILDAAA